VITQSGCEIGQGLLTKVRYLLLCRALARRDSMIAVASLRWMMRDWSAAPHPLSLSAFSAGLNFLPPPPRVFSVDVTVNPFRLHCVVRQAWQTASYALGLLFSEDGKSRFVCSIAVGLRPPADFHLCCRILLRFEHVVFAIRRF
jgi:hypothetical protein